MITLIPVQKRIRLDQKERLEEIVKRCQLAGVSGVDESVLVRWCLDVGLDEIEEYHLQDAIAELGVVEVQPLFDSFV